MIAFKPRIVNIFYKKIPDKSLHFHVIFMFFPDPAKDVPNAPARILFSTSFLLVFPCINSKAGV